MSQPKTTLLDPLKVHPFAKCWPGLVTTALVALAWVLMRTMPISHDVVWQMWVGRQMLGGSQLYSDIVEINPPLWYWLALPVEWFSQNVGVGQKTAIISAVFLYALLALAVLERLTADGELMAYRHNGFWQPMDTLREKKLLEEMWASGAAPWKVWTS